MYKALGLQFTKNPILEDKIHGLLVLLTSYYKSQNDMFFIDQNKRREDYRVAIQEDLPLNMSFSLWLKKKQRKYRLDVRDLSAGGAKVYLPFEDKSNIYKQGSFVDLLLEHPKGSIELSAAIRHVVPLNLSRVAKAALQKFESQIHPSDQKKDEKDAS